jgi:cation diffusion facilitator family transporter
VLLRVSVASALLNVALISVQLAIATVSGSLAVAAEATHNIADLAASFAVIVGLLISRRTASSFPYGLYKVENLVAVVIALSIFVAAYEIARGALVGSRPPLEIESWMIACVVVAGIAPLVFGRYELAVGRKANSPSVVADAREFQVHALTAAMVLVALLAESISLPVDRVVALVIVIVILRLGWRTLVDGMRVLLDASLDRDTLAEIDQILSSIPGVVAVRDLAGRNSGRFRFVEATLIVRAQTLARAHQLREEAADRVRESVPHIERILLDVAPRANTSARVAIPLQDAEGTVSEHFGTAPWFAFVDLWLEGREVEKRLVYRNPFAGDPRGRGLRVADWLLGNGADLLVTRDDIRDKGPGHALTRAGVRILPSRARRLEDTLEEALRQAAEGGPA